MTPIESYQQALATQHISPDASQAQVIKHLQCLYDELLKQQRGIQRLKKLWPRLFNKNASLNKGLYLWGDVGRGKTWLMDLFYDCLPFKNKYRMHFHRYMLQIHEQLQQYNGQGDPLKRIAKDFAKHYQILCLDEFHVADITDAMILYGLFDALLRKGLILVLTSNSTPDELYKDGLQRERFLPAIELIKHHTTIIELNGPVDHRLRLLEKAEVYYQPLNDDNRQRLDRCFNELAPCRIDTHAQLTINHRNIPVYKQADDVVWFVFNDLFNSPRATADYIEIARRFHTVVISDIPVLDEATEDKATRFINLMDEFYDRQVKVLISAVEQPERLYQGNRLTFEYQRTLSRLQEMRTHAYLQKPHRP